MEAMRGSWKQVAAASDLPPGSRKLVRTDGHSVLLFNVDGSVHAIADSCPHAGAWLGSGKLDGCFLRCPSHGLEFDLRTGCARTGQGLAVRAYPVQVEDDAVLVDLATLPVTPQIAGSEPGKSTFSIADNDHSITGNGQES